MSRTKTDESGFAAIWTALTLTVVVAMLGMGIDLGYWYFQGWKQQEAVDQAALAGAVFLPDRPDLARIAARQSARQNGYASNVGVNIGTGKAANTVKVTLDRTYGSFFSRVLGKTTQNIVRFGTAEYIPPLSLGSPSARAGNDPEDLVTPSPNFWLSQHGPWAQKHNGDRYAADNCVADSSVVHPIPYGCTGVGAAVRGLNTDYQRLGQYGYRYAVDVTNVNPGKDLVFEVFDGVTANVGSLCNYGNLPTATQRNALAAYVGDADTRYRDGNDPVGKPWCTADVTSFDPARSTQYMDTEFAVFSPVRSVAAGSIVQNTTPPTTVAPNVTTTLGPGGGNFVSAPCSPGTTSGATTLSALNDRATPTEVYWVNAACQETLLATAAPGATWSAATFEGYRYRFYDASSKEFVSDYIVPPSAATATYARRSLESAGAAGRFATRSSTVDLAASITTPTDATFEVVPALDATPGCISFKTTAAGTPLYLQYQAIGAAPQFSAGASSLLPEKSWCSAAGGTGLPTTRFVSNADATAYLARDPGTNALRVSTAALSLPIDLEWYVNMPFAPGPAEQVPINRWLTIAADSNGYCAEATGVSLFDPIVAQNCSGNLTQQFQFLVGTGSNVTIQNRAGTYAVRPALGGTSPGTPLHLETLAATTSDQWAPTVLTNARVDLRNVASNRHVTCASLLGAQLTVGATGAPTPCDLVQLRMVGAISPIAVSAGTNPPISIVEHLNNPGTCSTGGAPASLTVNNPATGPIGVYVLESGCRERFLGEVSAGGSSTYPGLFIGARFRLYDVALNRLVAESTISGSNFSAPLTGPGSPCSPTGSPPIANVTFVNQRTSPVRVYAIDSSCNVINFATLATNATWSGTSFVGGVWRTVDTYTGKNLRTVTLTGDLTVTEINDAMTSGNCSAASGAATSLDVINQRTTALVLKRVDAQCIETVEQTIAPSSTTSLASFVDERWKLYDLSGALVQDVTVAAPGPEVVTVVSPNSWTFDPNAGTQIGSTLICTRVETTYPLSSFNPADQHTGSVVQLINPVDGVHDNGAGTRDPFAESFTLGFRRWKQFCKIPAAQVVAGRYTLTVKTNLNDQSAGNNGFSLRAAWQGTTPTDRSVTGLQLSAIESLPVFVNFPGTVGAKLYLTRLNPTHAGRQLRIELYDIGDTASGTVNVRIVPPVDSNVGATWPCTMKLVSADGTFNPPNSNPANCSVNALTRQDYNGAAIQFTIPIPANFTCNPSVLTNCWTQVDITLNGGAQPTDRTTWSATMLGDPLRIVK